ncbi:MAG: hypothetical protein QOE88_2259 [Verrucomicrobiota bacterium]|nr:hypothetical protein [Verrucomicrobiota bacterium]
MLLVLSPIVLVIVLVLVIDFWSVIGLSAALKTPRLSDSKGQKSITITRRLETEREALGCR